MNSAADRRTGGVIPDARLPDVSELSLCAIFEGESALAGALRRYALETNSYEEYCTFGNFAPAPEGPPAVAVLPA
jgi:hypothetical protein